MGFLVNIICHKYKKGRNGHYWTEDLQTLQKLEKRFSSYEGKWWSKQANWTVRETSETRFCNQLSFVKNQFIPRLSKKMSVCDIASSNGIWSEYIAPFVSKVDGYEYSDKMVKEAMRHAIEQKIENVSYRVADFKNVIFEQSYDAAMIMGLLTCLTIKQEINDSLCRMVNQSAIKIGGVIITKDTLCINIKTDACYLINKKTGYIAAYWAYDIYKSFWMDVGFVLEEESIFEEVERDGYKFVSIGMIWKRIR